MHVEAGSSVVLKCNVEKYMFRPNHLWWFRNNERLFDGSKGITIEDNVDSVVNSGNSDPSKSLAPSWHIQEDSSLYSILTVKEASSKFSGKYSCVPEQCRPASINVHVILGKATHCFICNHLHTDTLIDKSYKPINTFLFKIKHNIQYISLRLKNPKY